MRLAAGLCPAPLGELKRSPRLPSRKTGPTSKWEGKNGERERKGEVHGQGKGKDREKETRGRKGVLPDQ